MLAFVCVFVHETETEREIERERTSVFVIAFCERVCEICVNLSFICHVRA